MHFSALAMTTAAVLAFGGVPLHAQTWQMPPDNQRCPSKWGAGDQRGSANMMKPETEANGARNPTYYSEQNVLGALVASSVEGVWGPSMLAISPLRLKATCGDASCGRSCATR